MKRLSKRIVSILLSVLTLVSMIPLTLLEVSAEEVPNGLELSLNWAGVEGDTYSWDSDICEYRDITLNIGYKNDGENAREYAPEELKIKVNGIGNANRDGVKKAYKIAADDLAKEDTSSSYKWKYTWDSENDEYTFVNKEKVEVGVDVSFEIIWSMNSQLTKNNYNQNVSASIYNKDDVLLTDSNILVYTETRKKSVYVRSFYYKGGGQASDSTLEILGIEKDDSKVYAYGSNYDFYVYTDRNVLPVYSNTLYIDVVVPKYVYITSGDNKSSVLYKTDDLYNYYKITAWDDGYDSNARSHYSVFRIDPIFACDKKYMNNGSVGHLSNNALISCTIKGVYYDDESTDFSDLYSYSYTSYVYESSEKVPTANIDWANRTWTKFNTVVSGFNTTNISSDSCGGDKDINKYVSPKDIYKTNKYGDFNITTRNTWVRGFDTYLKTIAEKVIIDGVDYTEKFNEDSIKDFDNGMCSYINDKLILRTVRYTNNDTAEIKTYLEACMITSKGKAYKKKLINSEESVVEFFQKDINDYVSYVDGESAYTYSVSDISMKGENPYFVLSFECSKPNYVSGYSIIKLSSDIIVNVDLSPQDSEKSDKKSEKSYASSEIEGLSVTYDKVFVKEKTGYYKLLSDEDYNIKSIYIDGDKDTFAPYRFNIYGCYKGENEYKLLTSVTTKDSTSTGTDFVYSYDLPEGVYKYKVFIVNKESGSDFTRYFEDFYIRARVDLHINKDNYNVEEYNGDIFVPSYYSYVMWENGGYKEYDLKDSKYFATNACSYHIPSPSSYPMIQKEDGSVCDFNPEYDKEVYGRYVTRGTNILNDSDSNYKEHWYTHIHCIENSVSVYLRNVDGSYDGQYSSDFSYYKFNNSYLDVFCESNDLDSPIDNFSVAVVLPSRAYIDGQDFNAVNILGQSITDSELRKCVKINIVEDYKGTGRVYLRWDFDLSSSPKFVSSSSRYKINISFIKYDMLINDMDPVKYGVVVNSNCLTGIKTLDVHDINNNGNTSEKALYYEKNLYYKSVAREYTRQSSLYAKSTVNTNFTKNNISVIKGSKYSYSLLFTPSTSTNYYGLDLIYMFPTNEWSGTFDGATLSDQNGKLYYTLKDNPTESDWQSYLPYDKSLVKGVRVLKSKSTSGYMGDLTKLKIDMIAPDSQDLVEKKATGSYTTKYLLNYSSDVWTLLDSNSISLTLVDSVGSINIEKRDSEDNRLLSNAVFTLSDKDGNILGEVKTYEGYSVWSKLPFGEYILKEKTAPKGYKLSDKEYNISLSDERPEVELSVLNERKKGTVVVNKTGTDIYQSLDDNNYIVGGLSDYNPLNGAVFELYNSNDEIIKSNITTDERGIAKISDLQWGDYYLKEVKAPEGYVITKESLITRFTVDENNVDNEINLTIKNGPKSAKLKVVAYELNDDGTLSNEPISGIRFGVCSPSDASSYKIYRKDISKADGSAFYDDVHGFVAGKYELTCVAVKDGYVCSDEKIPFELTSANYDEPLVLKVGIRRKTATIKFYKIDDKDYLVPGAKYGLYNEDGTLISTAITNEKGYALFEGVKWGIKYYLQELEAPSGHSINDEKYYVDVTENSAESGLVLSVEDDTLKGNVTLIKTDYTTGDVVPGAIYNVYKSDDTLVLEGLKTDSDGKLIAKDLDWGTYYFKEVTAPRGYCLSDEKIYFSVNYETILNEHVVTAEDIKKVDNTIRISKELSAADLNYAQGNPTFLYKVTGVTDENKEVGYSASIIFDKDSVDSYLNANPDSDVVVLTANIPVAEKGLYTITEQSVIRYADNKVNDIINGTDLGNSRVSFDINGSVNFGEVTFSSSKVINSGLSANAHSSSIISVVELPDRPMNKLVATYGEETLSTETIDKDKLVVYMQYTDGTKKALSNDDYTLSKETFDLSKYSDNTVYVTYTEDGKTYKTSFNITVAGSSEFSYHELDDGTIAIDGYLGSDTSVYFPSTINGKKVSSIETGTSNPIAGLSNIKEIVISEGIERIGSYAFYDVAQDEENTIKLTLSKSIRVIGDYAFEYSQYLELGDIYLSNCEYIGLSAFYYQKIRSLTLLGDNIVVASEAFYHATIGDIYIKGNDVNIGYQAFEYLNNNYREGFASNVTLINVSEFGHSAFYNANLKNVYIHGKDGCEIPYGVFQYINYDLREAYYNMYYSLSYSSNDHIQHLIDLTKNCTFKIENVKIIDLGLYNWFGDIEVIGNNTEVNGIGCGSYWIDPDYTPEVVAKLLESKLKGRTLTLKGSFSKLGRPYGLSSQMSYIDMSSATVETLGSNDGNLFNNSQYLEVVKLPKGVTSIRKYDFGRCPNLREVYGLEDCMTYGYHCFFDCSKLEILDGFRDDATIEEDAFKGTPFEQTLRDKGLIE